MKSIFEITQKELLTLPAKGLFIGTYSSIILLPLRKQHETGYSYIEIFGYDLDKDLITRLDKFDSVRIIQDSVIDILPKCKCTHIFVPGCDIKFTESWIPNFIAIPRKY
jgi:hypothetical protein